MSLGDAAVEDRTVHLSQSRLKLCDLLLRKLMPLEHFSEFPLPVAVLEHHNGLNDLQHSHWVYGLELLLLIVVYELINSLLKSQDVVFR